MLIWIAFALLCLVAAMGGVMLMGILAQRAPSPWLVGVHGLIAVTALVLLIVAAWRAGWPRGPSIAVGLVATQVLLGAAQPLFRRLRGDRLPIGLTLGHATLGAFVLAMVLSVAVARHMAAG